DAHRRRQSDYFHRCPVLRLEGTELRQDVNCSKGVRAQDAVTVSCSARRLMGGWVRSGSRRPDRIARRRGRFRRCLRPGRPIDLRPSRAWAVSSAIEHCFHTAGATGSIPVPPTIQNKDLSRIPEDLLLEFGTLGPFGLAPATLALQPSRPPDVMRSVRRYNSNSCCPDLCAISLQISG